ncbi:MAG: alpha/beta hydrolase [Rhodospirillales bacterium]|nr:alpha/beta hydrolase [Rhodospirillales bacterium]
MIELRAANAIADRYARTAEALTARQTPRLRDVEYAPGRLLDVYGDDADTVLLFLHGGGYTHGSKDWCGFAAPSLAPTILVAASYRLQPSVTLAQQQDDAASALAWTRARFPQARIVVGGHSAGAALAALLALRDASIAGAVCLSTSFAQFAMTGTQAAQYELPPGPLAIDPASPLALAGATRVPFLIGWGGGERQRDRVERSSMQMLTALRDHGVACDWLFLPGADHFDTHLALAEPGHAWSVALRAWLARRPG